LGKHRRGKRDPLETPEIKKKKPLKIWKHSALDKRRGAEGSSKKEIRYVEKGKKKKSQPPTGNSRDTSEFVQGSAYKENCLLGGGGPKYRKERGCQCKKRKGPFGKQYTELQKKAHNSL